MSAAITSHVLPTYRQVLGFAYGERDFPRPSVKINGLKCPLDGRIFLLKGGERGGRVERHALCTTLRRFVTVGRKGTRQSSIHLSSYKRNNVRKNLTRREDIHKSDVAESGFVKRFALPLFAGPSVRSGRAGKK